MKRTRAKSFAGAVMWLIFCAGATYSQTTLPGAVGRALADYDQSWNKKDVKAVAQILADDYVYFSSAGGLTARKPTLEFLASPDYKLTSVERSEIKIISQRDNIAVVTSRWKGRGTYGKEEINDDQRCGLVFVMQDKTWKLLSEHCVQIASK